MGVEVFGTSWVGERHLVRFEIELEAVKKGEIIKLDGAKPNFCVRVAHVFFTVNSESSPR